jgi:hypothetical protein
MTVRSQLGTRTKLDGCSTGLDALRRPGVGGRGVHHPRSNRGVVPGRTTVTR